MKIICPRCASSNSRWGKRCYACGLPIDAALRTGAQSPVERIKSSGEDRQRQPADAAAGPLTDMLGIEAEHVRALAAADIRTLEQIAQAPPETIEHVLRVCTLIDPEALIARAQQQLHSGKTSAGETSEKEEPDSSQPLLNEPNLDEWWKMR